MYETWMNKVVWWLTAIIKKIIGKGTQRADRAQQKYLKNRYWTSGWCINDKEWWLEEGSMSKKCKEDKRNGTFGNGEEFDKILPKQQPTLHCSRQTPHSPSYQRFCCCFYVKQIKILSSQLMLISDHRSE